MCLMAAMSHEVYLCSSVFICGFVHSFGCGWVAPWSSRRLSISRCGLGACRAFHSMPIGAAGCINPKSAVHELHEFHELFRVIRGEFLRRVSPTLIAG